MRYALWIFLLRLNPERARGRCKELAEEMQAVFPELRLVRGHYHDEQWGRQEHWWLQRGDRVIDPTAVQFPSAGRGLYEEHPEGAEEPTGQCLNCGDYVFDYTPFCCARCDSEFREDLYD